jgi:hypothetical protein
VASSRAAARSAIEKWTQAVAGADQTRRQFLKALGAGAAGAVVVGNATAASQSSDSASDAAKANSARSPLTHSSLAAFRLAEVRLLQGPFLDAQHRDEQYLLRLEPDRLLHNFRVNARLAPKAAVYGGWESQEPWVEIRCHGHTLGHYLSA